MGIIVAAAAFVAVLVGSSVIALLTTSGDTADIADMSAPTTRSALANIPLSGAVGDSAAVEAFAAVEDAYRLYNSGDAAGWVEIRDRGSFYESASMRQQILLPVIERTRLEIEANTRYEVIRCSSLGFGEWPRVTDEGIPVAVGYLFTCDAAVISDSPVYEGTESFNWVSSGGMVVAVNSSFSPTATPMRSTQELGE